MLQAVRYGFAPAGDESLRGMLKDERLQNEILVIDAADDREKVNQYSFVCFQGGFALPCGTSGHLAAMLSKPAIWRCADLMGVLLCILQAVRGHLQ